ncbi:GNAT family N-acetyltransferase [Paenibacillus sp. HB172176]|uniref:GNAT family N-acetyltransferase n=1 Tax=Paenibacillus sp. HB172176 TaxID=2493690 RepID=UPI001439A867|nr:GNAT family N-acetyltransferase [Paenibacillus sp. HB172176]
MNGIMPSADLVTEIELSEIDYMSNRMEAIQNRPNNPEGAEVRRFGNAVCYYSKTMPWPSFNTVKGLRSEDIEQFDSILDFYQARDRKAQFEIVPSFANQKLLRALADRGYYQSGFHNSLYMEPKWFGDEETDSGSIRIEALREDQINLYAAIHCKGTGLPDGGIPHVAQNNKVLLEQYEWSFYLAYYDDVPAAVGVMFMKDGTASLTFAATLPEFRGKGLQQALLKHRVSEAYRHDCRLVVGQCAFLSQSHRNMERIGMKLGYVRTTWTKV